MTVLMKLTTLTVLFLTTTVSASNKTHNPQRNIAGACWAFENSENPCQNGGICRQNEQDAHSFTCECRHGFSGRYCEANINPCTPCMNSIYAKDPKCPQRSMILFKDIDPTVRKRVDDQRRICQEIHLILKTEQPYNLGNPDNVTSLDLSYGLIHIIPRYIFDEVSNLKSLALHHNKLSTVKGITILPGNLFEQNKRLEKLELGFNDLTEIPTGLLAGLTKLQKLSLFNNLFIDFKNDPFQDLTDLKSLDLRKNNIAALDESLFRNLKQLRAIYLSGNLITTIPQNCFTNSPFLDHLELGTYKMYNMAVNYSNPIIETPVLSEIITKNNSITFLVVESTRIRQLPNFQDMSSLKFMKLRGNRISSLKVNSFWGLTELVKLNLRDNKISYVPTGIFDLQLKLRRLDLSVNRISGLPENVFDKLVSLEELDISRNQIKTVSNLAFKNLPNIREIMIDKNQISQVPESLFQGIPSLKRVDVSKNPYGKKYANDLCSNLCRDKTVEKCKARGRKNMVLGINISEICDLDARKKILRRKFEMGKKRRKKIKERMKLEGKRFRPNKNDGFEKIDAGELNEEAGNEVE